MLSHTLASVLDDEAASAVGGGSAVEAVAADGRLSCDYPADGTEAGFEWGGDWTSCKDFQHFELIEE